MSLVRFLRDFQGTATAGAYYLSGTVADLPSEQVSACLAENVVVLVGEVPPPTDTGAGDGPELSPPTDPAPAVEKPKRKYTRKAKASE